MSSKLKVRMPSPAMVVALLALFVAMGGSVYAASQINGTTIKKNSLPGNRIKKDSVTGKQVKESTLGTVPNATNATNATTATNATNATTAATANGPVAWAHVNSSGVVVDGRGITSANIVRPYLDGEFCFKNLGFAFKSLQANVDAKDNGGDLNVTAQVAVGDPIDCNVGPGGAGTQAGVVTGNGGTTLPAVGFFVWFFD
jgi:hypothetical protein